MNQNQSLSIEWENVANCLFESRSCLKDPDARSRPYRAMGPFQETIVALAHAVRSPDIESAVIGVAPGVDGSSRVLESFFSLKLGEADQRQSLQTAQKILNNATYFRRTRITSLEDAQTRLEAIVALVNIAADLSDITPELVTNAG